MEVVGGLVRRAVLRSSRVGKSRSADNLAPRLYVSRSLNVHYAVKHSAYLASFPSTISNDAPTSRYPSLASESCRPRVPIDISHAPLVFYPRASASWPTRTDASYVLMLQNVKRDGTDIQELVWQHYKAFAHLDYNSKRRINCAKSHKSSSVPGRPTICTLTGAATFACCPSVVHPSCTFHSAGSPAFLLIISNFSCTSSPVCSSFHIVNACSSYARSYIPVLPSESSGSGKVIPGQSSKLKSMNQVSAFPSFAKRLEGCTGRA